MAEMTFSIIKPDAVRRNLCGKVLGHLEESDFTIAAMEMTTLTRPQAEGFYAEHKERPFFGELVDYMTSGPVVLLALKRNTDAVSRLREVMGATDPAKADAGTIRKTYGVDVGQNSIHGSDSPESASRELNYFFPGYLL